MPLESEPWNNARECYRDESSWVSKGDNPVVEKRIYGRDHGDENEWVDNDKLLLNTTGKKGEEGENGSRHTGRRWIIARYKNPRENQRREYREDRDAERWKSHQREEDRERDRDIEIQGRCESSNRRWCGRSGNELAECKYSCVAYGHYDHRYKPNRHFQDHYSCSFLWFYLPQQHLNYIC